MTSAQVVETSVTNNSSFQDYPNPDDHTIRTIDNDNDNDYNNNNDNNNDNNDNNSNNDNIIILF